MADSVEYADLSATAESDHQRSSRSLQLPIRLSSDYVVDANPFVASYYGHTMVAVAYKIVDTLIDKCLFLS